MRTRRFWALRKGVSCGTWAPLVIAADRSWYYLEGFGAAVAREELNRYAASLALFGVNWLQCALL